METLIVKNSTAKTLFFILTSFSILGLSMFFFFFPNQPIFNYLGGFGLLISGFLTLAHLGRLFDRKPRLIINNEGIYDRSLKIDTIDWYDIESAYIQKIREAHFICLTLKDEGKYINEIYQTNNKIKVIKDYFGMEAININIDGLAISEAELLQTIKEQISQHQNPPKPVSIFDTYNEN